MNCSVFSEYEWLYPDSPPSAVREIQLEGARGAYVGCQLLGGEIGQGEALSCSVRWTGEALPQPVLFQMIDVGVPKNSDPVAFTTLDYASCADYVTRQAPFRVYDALRPLSDGPTRPGRLALYLRFRLPAGQKPGTYTGMLTLTAGAQIDELPVSVTLHAATIPSPGEGRLGLINCFHFQNITAWTCGARNIGRSTANTPERRPTCAAPMSCSPPPCRCTTHPAS